MIFSRGVPALLMSAAEPIPSGRFETKIATRSATLTPWPPASPTPRTSCSGTPSRNEPSARPTPEFGPLALPAFPAPVLVRRAIKPSARSTRRPGSPRRCQVDLSTRGLPAAAGPPLLRAADLRAPAAGAPREGSSGPRPGASERTASSPGPDCASRSPRSSAGSRRRYRLWRRELSPSWSPSVSPSFAAIRRRWRRPWRRSALSGRRPRMRSWPNSSSGSPT